MSVPPSNDQGDDMKLRQWHGLIWFAALMLVVGVVIGIILERHVL